MADIDFAKKILRGEVELLGVEEITARLGVSRNTYERWVRNGKPLKEMFSANQSRNPIGFQSLGDVSANLNEGHIRFPQPDIYIGKSPKWNMDTVAAWLLANSK
jgi:hypothetical protein